MWFDLLFKTKGETTGLRWCGNVTVVGLYSTSELVVVNYFSVQPTLVLTRQHLQLTESRFELQADKFADILQHMSIFLSPAKRKKLVGFLSW